MRTAITADGERASTIQTTDFRNARRASAGASAQDASGSQELREGLGRHAAGRPVSTVSARVVGYNVMTALYKKGCVTFIHFLQRYPKNSRGGAIESWCDS